MSGLVLSPWQFRIPSGWENCLVNRDYPDLAAYFTWDGGKVTRRAAGDELRITAWQGVIAAVASVMDGGCEIRILRFIVGVVRVGLLRDAGTRRPRGCLYTAGEMYVTCVFLTVKYSRLYFTVVNKIIQGRDLHGNMYGVFFYLRHHR